MKSSIEIYPLAEREAAQRRCDAATPGPWDQTLKMDGYTAVGAKTLIARVFSPVFKDHMIEHANAELISHARTDLPRALEALRAAERENAELRAERDMAKQNAQAILEMKSAADTWSAMYEESAKTAERRVVELEAVVRMAEAVAKMELGEECAPDFGPRELLHSAQAALSQKSTDGAKS